MQYKKKKSVLMSLFDEKNIQCALSFSVGPHEAGIEVQPLGQKKLIWNFWFGGCFD